jgi:hypothetical protein
MHTRAAPARLARHLGRLSELGHQCGVTVCPSNVLVSNDPVWFDTIQSGSSAWFRVKCEHPVAFRKDYLTPFRLARIIFGKPNAAGGRSSPRRI